MPRYEIEEVKRRNPIEQVAAHLGIEIGRSHKARCPAPNHPDESPSAHFYLKDGTFHCFGCGAHGDAIDLVMITQGMDKGEAITWLAQRAGMAPGQPAAPRPRPKPPPPKPAPVATEPHPLLAEFLSRARPLEGECLSYLEGRGIPADLAALFGIRCLPADAKVVTGFYRERDKAEIEAAGVGAFYAFEKVGLPYLVFPYHQGGRVVYLKARCLVTEEQATEAGIGQRFRNTGGTIPCPYNGDRLSDPQVYRVFVAEGEIDTLTLEAHGYPAVGVPGAGNFREEWADPFAQVDVYLAMDPDQAGEAGMGKIAAAFADRGRAVRRLPLPAGQDVNEFFGRRIP